MGRTLIASGLLLLLASCVGAQDRALATRAPGTGYFGAPVVEYTMIRDQGVLMFGGRGGWNIAPSLLLGGGLYATMTEVDARGGAVPEVPGVYDVKFEKFGAEVEYARDPAAAAFLTLRAFLGGGAVHYVKDGTDEQMGETDFVFVVEPSIGVERRVTRGFHVNLSGYYRLAGGVEHVALDDGDIRGTGVTLAVKLGRFPESR